MSFNINKLVQSECGAPNPLVAAAQQIAMKPSSSGLSSVQLRQVGVNFSKEFMQQKLSQDPTSNLLQNSIRNNNMQASFVMRNPNAIASTSSMNTQVGGIFATDFLTEQQLSQGVQRLHMSGGSHQMTFKANTDTSLSSSAPLDTQQMMARMMTQNALSNQLGAIRESAADQLEAKYRNDLMSQSKDEGKEKLDDVKFWQGLMSNYIGPSVYDEVSKQRALSGMKTEETQKSATKATTSQVETASLIEPKTVTTEQHQGEESNLENVDLEPELTFEESAEPNLEYTFDERNPLKGQYEDPFAEGLKKLEQGDIPSAALLFEAAVQEEPKNALAWRYLGTTQAQNERDTSAIRALNNCLNLNRNDQEALLAISVSLANETQHLEACKYLLEWLINHERYKSVGASLDEFARLQRKQSEYYQIGLDEAQYKYVCDKFVAAARMSPNNPDPEVQCSLGVVFNMRGEYDKAVDCFKAALSVRSNDSLLWNRLGATLANGNKSDEAVIAYRKALEISPGFLRSRYNLAISLIHLSTYDEAAKQLIQILNTQAAGKGSKNSQIRTRSITSFGIWNTLRTVATLLNKPDLYPIIDGRDLVKCNEMLFRSSSSSNTTSGGNTEATTTTTTSTDTNNPTTITNN